MPIDPFTVFAVAAPWLYEQAKREHQCLKCKNWKLNINRVSSCCNLPICDSCIGRSLVRKGGVMCCPACGAEFE